MINHLINNMNSNFVEYLRDESRTEGTAESISFPKNEEEAIILIKALYPRGIPITIQGARTGLAAGAVPNGGHIMNLSRMDKITSMRKDEKDLFYVSVQPGTILSNLKEGYKQLEQTIKRDIFRFQQFQRAVLQPRPHGSFGYYRWNGCLQRFRRKKLSLRLYKRTCHST